MLVLPNVYLKMSDVAYGIALEFVGNAIHPIRQTTHPQVDHSSKQEEVMLNTHQAMLIAILLCWILNTRSRWIAEICILSTSSYAYIGTQTLVSN